MRKKGVCGGVIYVGRKGGLLYPQGKGRRPQCRGKEHLNRKKEGVFLDPRGPFINNEKRRG